MKYIFETVVIFDSNHEAVIDATIKKLTSIIQAYDDTKRVRVEDKGVKRLAYEIKGHATGHYALFTYLSDPENISKLERRLRIDDTVLKFITVRQETIDEDEILEDLTVESEQKITEDKKQIVDVLDIIYNLNNDI